MNSLSPNREYNRDPTIKALTLKGLLILRILKGILCIMGYLPYSSVNPSET